MPRILLLDDEPLISMLVEDWLRELGCEVVGPARSVQEGLEFVGTSPLDAAILDVNLGGQNCYPVAKALRIKDIPFAFATGDGGVDVESGFVDPILLPKPFDFEAVKSTLAALLAKAPKVSATR